MKAPKLFRSCFLFAALLPPVGSLQAQTSLTLSSATVAPGGTATLYLSLSSPTPTPLGAVQWTLSYPAPSVANFTVIAGPALSSAGKTITCSPATGSYACLAWGSNSNVISSGVVATVSVTPSGSTSVPITVSGSQAASVTGDPIGVIGTGGVVGIAAGTVISSIFCAPGTLLPGASSTCTVGLSGSGGGVVSLSSNSANLAVPPSLTIPAGSSSGSFLATAATFSGAQVATVTAALNGSTQSFAISLAANTPSTLSLECSPTSLTINSVTSCSVTLSSAASTTTSVALSSDNPALIVLAPSVIVPAGSASARFTEITGVFTTDQTATLTATLNGTAATSRFSLVASATLSSLDCTPKLLAPNAGATCTLTLSKAPAGATTVSLSSSSGSLTVPTTVMVPANSASFTFAATAGSFTADQSATVTATWNATSVQSTLALVAPATLSALQCAAGSLTSNATTTCTVTLTKGAPDGGLSVSLSSSLPSLLSVPPTVTVPANASSAAFTASAGTIATTQSAFITATQGASSFTAVISLTGPTTAKPLSLTCSPAILRPGSNGTCTVSLAAPASSPTVIGLIPTYQPNQAFVIPASITIPAGATSSTVIFTTTTALTSVMTLVATLGSSSHNAAVFNFTVQAPGGSATAQLMSLACATRVKPGISGLCELRLSPSATSQMAPISLTSSSGNVKVPHSLRAIPGQNMIRFEVLADPESPAESAFLEATAGESTVRASVDVIPPGPRLLAPDKVAFQRAATGRFQVSTTGAATITATGLPSGSRFDPSTGTFEWTPTTADAGEHYISFLTTDPQGTRTRGTVAVFVGTGAPVVTQLRNLAGGAVCSPGAIATVSGWFLSSAGTPFTDRSGRSRILNDTQVLVNGASAPLLSASAGSLEFLCPSLAAPAPLEIAVQTPAGQSGTLHTAMAETAPAIVTVDGSIEGQALAIRANSVELASLPNSRLPAAPALSGEPVYLWATGIECATSSRLWLNLGGQPVDIDSAQPVPQMAGLCQIAFRVPTDITGDSVPLTIETRRTDTTTATGNRTSIAIHGSSLDTGKEQ